MTGPLDIAQCYRDHAPFVGRMIRRQTGEGAHVDDLTQEVFIVAHRRNDDFSGQSSVETWLYGITANLCLNHERSKRRYGIFKGKIEQASSVGDSDSPALDMTMVLERKETVLAVHQILQELPFKQREVFILYELEEKEGADIAAMIGIPLGTVWTRLRKA